MTQATLSPESVAKTRKRRASWSQEDIIALAGAVRNGVLTELPDKIIRFGAEAITDKAIELQLIPRPKRTRGRKSAVQPKDQQKVDAFVDAMLEIRDRAGDTDRFVAIARYARKRFEKELASSKPTT